MAGTIDLPFGLATSVGPLPSADPVSAVRMALRAQADFPSSPTLGTTAGSLLAQAVAGVDGVEVLPPGLLRVTPDLLAEDPVGGVDTGGASLEGPAHATFREFLAHLSPRPAVGVRLGVLGPVTLALGLRAAGVPTERAVRMAAALVAQRSAAMLSATRSVMPDGVVLVCASEPGLIGAVHPTFPLTPAQVLGLLTPFVDALDRHPDAGQLLIGAHVPGRTDWATVIASGVSVVSAPVGHDLVGWAPTLGDFVERGGRLVWGAVPVDQPLGTSEELLWRRLSAMWCELVAEGMDPLLLRSRSLIGPVDGLGHFGVTQAERALDLVDSLSTRVRRQAIGARLTLGA
jgi:hypothetical protein